MHLQKIKINKLIWLCVHTWVCKVRLLNVCILNAFDLIGAYNIQCYQRKCTLIRLCISHDCVFIYGLVFIDYFGTYSFVIRTP